MKKRTMNAATIAVTYPDGCTQRWETRRDAPLATDAVKFADWLGGIAESIRETALTPGQCTVESVVFTRLDGR